MAAQHVQRCLADAVMEMLQSKASDEGNLHFPSLFPSPAAALTEALAWARENATRPNVAAWARACVAWDAALADGTYRSRAARRKLQAEHPDVSINVAAVDAEPDEAAQHVQRCLADALMVMRDGRASGNSLARYFQRKPVGVKHEDGVKVQPPKIAADPSSAYLILRAKQHEHAGDKDFQIVLQWLGTLRNSLTRQQIRRLLKEASSKKATIQKCFRYKNIAEVRHRCPGEKTSVIAFATNASVCYHASLLVLAQARRWLLATEQMQSSTALATTPKTVAQLASAIRDPEAALCAPYGADFEDLDNYGPIASRLLLYAELHGCSDHTLGTYTNPRGDLPYTYRQLQNLIFERRCRPVQTADEGRRPQLIGTADDLAAMLREFASNALVLRALLDFALPPHKREASWAAVLAQPAEADASRMPASAASGATARRLKTYDEGQQNTVAVVGLAEHAARKMAKGFFKFVEEGRLQGRVATLGPRHIVVLCIFHCRLTWQKGKPMQLRPAHEYCIPKPKYTPAALVTAPSPAYFVERAREIATEHSRPCMQPPQRCCLCGKGMVDLPALWRHCDIEHHSWAEAVKRTLWEATHLHDLPVMPSDKRRIIQNFAAALTYTKPAGGHFGGKACVRQLVGCATCARVGWIDGFFPCFIFKPCPAAARPMPDDESAESCAAATSEDEDGAPATKGGPGALLKDEMGYYVASAEAVHELLDVEKYIAAWPRIPREELHASSVQHPRHPGYRWLMNTRRVPTEDAALLLQGEKVAAATEHPLPRCAGVGREDEPVWLCTACTRSLCRTQPRMPFFALSNWNWGGRLHPLYYNLSIATQALLGLAIMVCRLVVLRHSEHPDEQEKGFVGNTILLAQPPPEEIMSALPPTSADVSKYLSVCFNGHKVSAAALGAQKALQVDPDEYIRCVRLRQKVCPVFADVALATDRVYSQWPGRGVPSAIVEGAQAMDTLHTFTPTLDGPASTRAATCKLPVSDDANLNVIPDEDDDGDAATEHADRPTATEHATAAGDPADVPGLPLDTPAEYLIGVQQDDSHDPVDRMVAFQKNIEMIHEAGVRMHSHSKARAHAQSQEEATAAAAALAAERATHAAALVDLRSLAQKMGSSYHEQLEEALASARAEGPQNNTPQTLHVKSGRPVNVFEPQAWSAAFVQFFYGDCAPNLDRPQKVCMRNLFCYLAEREELQYTLDTDAADPLIPGGCYKAPSQSRWNTPEFMAVFSDVVRKIAILQTTRHMWKGNAPQWRLDIKTICEAKVEHFEKLATIIAHSGHQNLAQITRAAAEHNVGPLLKALQYVTFQTANIPLTPGYKASLRHFGHTLNVYDGPLSIFLTTNFADTYSPITAILMDGAGEPMGKRVVNLLDNAPAMPTLQAMHRALAKHPMLQARLFLLLDELVHTELLCMAAFIGTRVMADTSTQRGSRGPLREDDFAATCQIGLAQFPRAALKPLEAQGRGFAHGHEKITSVPRMRAARLKQLFTAVATERGGEDELARWCKRAREELLRAACSLQYDSAILSGAQLQVDLLPEPFSKVQQRRSRFDGEVEEMDDNAPLRAEIKTTAPEPNGHIRAEAEKATAEQRPQCRAYQDLPLTGAFQSLMPMYRRPDSFGRIIVPDEFGYYPNENASAQFSHAGGLRDILQHYEIAAGGEVVGFRMPDGTTATPADVDADSKAWATSFARDQRAGFIQNHNHDCTATCVKHQKKKGASADSAPRPGNKVSGACVPKCRFRFYRYTKLLIAGAVKYVLRRGKNLVEEAMVSVGNEENEYGKVMPVRTMPFTSSSSDVLQATIRCNADYQYQKRGVPEPPGHTRAPAPCATEHGRGQDASGEPPAKRLGAIFQGCGRAALALVGNIVATLAIAMRAANVADFYMTKYLSKAQESLGSVMQPFIAGMRRTEQEEANPAAAPAGLVEQARRRIRRFIFCANRTMWFSACELAVFLATNDCVVQTEKCVKTFSGKGFAMMQECKRILNHSTASEGLLMPRRASNKTEDAAMQAFYVQMDASGDSDRSAAESSDDDESIRDAAEPQPKRRRAAGVAERAVAGSVATEQQRPGGAGADSSRTSAERSDEDKTFSGAAEPQPKRRRAAVVAKITAAGSIATEQRGGAKDDAEKTLSDLLASESAPSSCNKMVFTKTFAHRDDWLHRGSTLSDVDYYHYARFFDRVDLPRKGGAADFQNKYGVFHLFEPHYAYAASHVQVLRAHPRAVQNVGPQCKRSDVNSGEDNALYKAYFHTCVRCPCAGECANPLIYQPLLFPKIDDVDKHLALLQSTPAARRVEVRFAPAWKARRYEIEVLADRASAKLDTAKRIGVIRDTTAFKRAPVLRAAAPAAAAETHFHTRMLQILVQRLVAKDMGRGTCPERIMGLVMECAGVPLPWHVEQPHLAEWQAHSTREILFQLDCSVDARNLAQAQARKHASQLVQDDMDEDDVPASTARQFVEDLGGAPADLEDDMCDEDAGATKCELRLPVPAVARVLARTTERNAAGNVGRPRDMHKEMQKVAATFGYVLDCAAASFPVRQVHDSGLGLGLHAALEHQKERAEMMRREQVSEDADPVATEQGDSDPGAALLTEAAARLLEGLPAETTALGPAHVAKHLADAATLNRDQLGAVALVAHDMQKAWVAQGRPELLKPVGRILRMLLLGGGGCGKTRIVNLVLTPLFFKFWGERGCVKVAPSNKAARGILGKTLHAAAKLGAHSLDMKALASSQKTQTALAYLWAPCGALVVDEAPQGAAALYHALSLRCMLGRAAAHQLEIADYAEAPTSFGAMPIVVECGDELQLPPVPPSSGLFADLLQASTVHLAGVDIFKQKDYVYRLSTMKRFTDATQVSILTKMRRQGGCKLTTKEWKALRDTNISDLPSAEQQRRLEGTGLWYQSAPTWATVAMAQVIRSRLSAEQAAATLYFIPAQDYVLNRPGNPRLTNAYLAEQIACVPNMNNTGRLPSIAMIHVGMKVRLTNTVEQPEAVTDSTAVVVGIDLHPDDALVATEHESLPLATVVLRKLPLAVILRLDEVTTEFLPPCPCDQHAHTGADRTCPQCDFRPGQFAVEPQLSHGSFPVDIPDPKSDSMYTLRVQRRQLPITIRAASTLHTLQGATADPGLIFHWKFPRFFSEESRWLATYVALSRPPSFAQLISLDMPATLRQIIEGGPPAGITTQFSAMFGEAERATHLHAARLMLELGWGLQDAG